MSIRPSLPLAGCIFAALSLHAASWANTPFSDITQGSWHMAGLSSGYGPSDGALARTNTVISGSAVASGNSTSGYTFDISHSSHQPIVFADTGDASSLNFAYSNPFPFFGPSSHTRAIIHRLDADLMLYQEFSAFHTSNGDMFSAGTKMLVLSRSPLGAVNLGTLVSDTYDFDYHHQSAGRMSFPAPGFGFSTGALEVNVGGGGANIDAGAGPDALTTTSVGAGFSVLRSSDGPFFGTETIAVQLSAWKLFYASVGITPSDIFAMSNYQGQTVDRLTSIMGVATAIPEPSAFAAWAGGLILAGAGSRRRRRST